jgi:acetolactate synthase-1/2/3 large subunit
MTNQSTVKLSDYVTQFLVSKNVKNIFLLPGGGSMHLVDSVGSQAGLQFVCCLHEQACAFAAEAYGEFTNELGCCMVTSGPGGTNTVTGVACAWIESSPCLFISGQAKRSDMITSLKTPVRSKGPQEVDLVAVVKHITKYATTLSDPHKVRYELEKAYWYATTGRKGPVWIEIPLDVQAAQINPNYLAGFTPPDAIKKDYTFDIDIILNSLAKSKKPVIYAGNGVRTANVINGFKELIELIKAPVLLTWKAVDFIPEEDPYYVGRPGGAGQRGANFTQQKADWMLVLGARLDLPSTAFDHSNFAKDAYKILVDIDSAEIDKFPGNINHKIEADLKDFIPQLLKTARSIQMPNFNPWLSWTKKLSKKYPVVLPEYWNQPEGFANTYVLIEMLSEALNQDDIIVPGSSGPCSDILLQAIKVKQGQRILNAPGLGSMGTGLPGTIGACIAGNRRRVINVNGDGGFQLNIQELETVRRLRLPIKYFILDNNGYRSIVAMQRSHFSGRMVGSDPSSGLTLPNTCAVANAYNIRSIYVDSHDKLREAIKVTLAGDDPAICVVRVSADEKTAPRVTSEIKPDGSITPKPMEDMSPFLDRDEFNSVMATEF